MTPIKRNLPEGIYQRGNVLWVKVYENGKPVQKSTGTSDVAQATRFRDQMRAKAARGELTQQITQNGILVNELLDDDLARMENECKPDTVRWAKRAFVNHLRPFFGHIPANTLSTDIMEAYQRQRLSQNIARSTINNELAMLRSAFYTGYRRKPRKVAEVPPFPMYSKTVLNNVREGFLEWEEYERMLEVIEASLKCFLVILYHTGLRKGEAIGLKWSQVNFKARTIRLNPGDTKNLDGRLFPMYQDMEPFLKRQKEIRDSLFPWQDAVFFWMPESVTKGQDGGVRVSPGSPLGGDGQHFKTTKAWKEAAAAIGKPNLLMHDMRRSAVRNMIELAGMSAKQAMLYSGHRTMSMIERYHILGKGEIESARGKLQTMARENTTRPEPAPAEEPMVATMPSNVISFSSLKRKVAG